MDKEQDIFQNIFLCAPQTKDIQVDMMINEERIYIFGQTIPLMCHINRPLTNLQSFQHESSEFSKMYLSMVKDYYTLNSSWKYK